MDVRGVTSVCAPLRFLCLLCFAWVQFEELSRGKGYITEKALRGWDELQELVEAGKLAFLSPLSSLYSLSCLFTSISVPMSLSCWC